MNSEVQLFDRLLQIAVESGASDVHVKTGKPAVFRINRELVPVESPIPTEEWMNKVVSAVVPSHLTAQVGHQPELDFSYFVSGVGRFRTNLFRQRGQWSFAMRHVKSAVPGFAELGLPEQVRRIAESPRGIVLVVLRQDPDVIMIGEMRDDTSFAAAMSAADTGHLVLSTVHTTNASQSVGRILDFFKAEEREQIRRQLANTLQAVICQRMVTTLAGSMTPALEILMNTATVKKLIEENRLDKLAAAIETGTEDGMINFNQALYNLVKQGTVRENEALSKATNPQALEMNFKGIFLDEGRRILG